MGNECQAACQKAENQNESYKPADMNALTDKQSLYNMLIKDQRMINKENDKNILNKKKKNIFDENQNDLN